MKKLIVNLSALLILAAVIVPIQATELFTLEKEGGSFASRELSLNSFYQVQLEDLGHVDKARGDGIGVGATYYHTENIGAAISVLGDDSLGGVIDQLSAGIRLRYPIGAVAPYALADVIYDINGTDRSYLVGGGLEYRFNRVSIFAEIGQRLDYSGPDLTARIGAGWSF